MDQPSWEAHGNWYCLPTQFFFYPESKKKVGAFDVIIRRMVFYGVAVFDVILRRMVLCGWTRINRAVLKGLIDDSTSLCIFT